MLSANFVIFIAFAYVCLLFVLAYFGDKRARDGNAGFLRSPLVYTLSISVYCTSWTFYGAVGSAARNGLEFLTIYMGPTLVFVGWWFILRKLVRIGRTQRITSVADLLSSRFGKSGRLAVLVTLIAVIGTTPYIALQLKAITSSIRVISAADVAGGLSSFDDVTLALGVAAGMALFTILFGTRNVDAKEQHHGVVAAIAFEAVIKMLALLAVGIFVVFGVGGGFEEIYVRAVDAGISIHSEDTFGPRWVAILVLSAAAVLCLPRQFQITVVENSNEDHLRTAGWAFPTYLLLMSVFTMPIALYGLTTLPNGSNPDMFVLTLPLATGNTWLALFAFIGGFSSATSMIIVATIALSIMVSNHIVMPIALSSSETLGTGDGRGVTQLLLNSRRISIAFVLFLGFLYFWLTGNSDALAAIGLISFAGVAQFLPAMIAALYWRDATVKGAIWATLTGFSVWAWTMFLPSFGSASPWISAIMEHGPWGITLLRPEALFGLEGMDPLVHSVFWSLFLNSAILILVSIFTSQSTLERVQATLFVDVFRRHSADQSNFIRGSATVNDLFFVAQRILGGERTYALFEGFARERGVPRGDVEPNPELIGQLERELAGSIGAASAHVMLSKVVSGNEVSLEEVMQIADETQQVIEYSQRLEQTSEELRNTAAQLQEANEQMRKLDQQKDEFLSQVSHEVRTPMTSIRSFAEILLEHRDLSGDQRTRFTSTIHQESLRLTRLLDEILDLSALERGEREWVNAPIDPNIAIARAIEVCEPLLQQRDMQLNLGETVAEVTVAADPDRLAQVFINLLSNAIKYNDDANPYVRLSASVTGKDFIVHIEDNGPGIDVSDQRLIFEKFSRGRRRGNRDEAGSGLGLAISYQIITRMNGRLDLVSGRGRGACFRVTLPLVPAEAQKKKRRPRSKKDQQGAVD
ncbi:sensor histidine kinase [Mariluticola halotolerans]|uniref:sensor histidine kinase n=1 Tax=Mariluticola halotolerans TaxID=2909283 RepID=UPI0026E28675|nr:sensor histidine kinase [Mariluticola halotolerans]UJQ95566.1 sensor histidine kinase [Mariluticola halotolerans]